MSIPVTLDLYNKIITNGHAPDTVLRRGYTGEEIVTERHVTVVG